MAFIFEPWKREKFDPEYKLNNEWVACAPMQNKRSNFAHCLMDNMVYVFGGISGTDVKARTHYPVLAALNCERYDPKQDKWQEFEIKHAPCLGAFAWTECDSGQIFISGGTDGYLIQ